MIRGLDIGLFCAGKIASFSLSERNVRIVPEPPLHESRKVRPYVVLLPSENPGLQAPSGRETAKWYWRIVFQKEKQGDVLRILSKNVASHGRLKQSLSDVYSRRKLATLDSWFELLGCDSRLSLNSLSTVVHLVRMRRQIEKAEQRHLKMVRDGDELFL